MKLFRQCGTVIKMILKLWTHFTRNNLCVPWNINRNWKQKSKTAFGIFCVYIIPFQSLCVSFYSSLSFFLRLSPCLYLSEKRLDVLDIYLCLFYYASSLTFVVYIYFFCLFSNAQSTFFSPLFHHQNHVRLFVCVRVWLPREIPFSAGENHLLTFLSKWKWQSLLNNFFTFITATADNNYGSNFKCTCCFTHVLLEPLWVFVRFRGWGFFSIEFPHVLRARNFPKIILQVLYSSSLTFKGLCSPTNNILPSFQKFCIHCQMDVSIQIS